MKLLIATTALAAMLGQYALAQTAEADQAPVGNALGGAGRAPNEGFFIVTPEAYHILASQAPGQPMYLHRTATGLEQTTVDAAGAEVAVPPGVNEGTEPVGVITDVVFDRAGEVAGLVISLDQAMGGGEREVAVAIGLLRMLPGSVNANETLFLLALDPADLMSAPDFQRPPESATPPGAAAGGSP